MQLLRHIKPVSLALSLCLGGVAAKADVVTIVSAKSPLTALNSTQVADLFFARTSTFPNGMQAIPIDQEEGSAARDEFYARISGKSAAQVKAFWSRIIFTGRGRPPLSVSGDVEVKKRICENKVAIGYIDRRYVDDSVKIILESPPGH